jgi:short-subunit dehydrogenase
MSDQVWLIGASEGIGASLARRLAKEGYVIALSSRNVERLEALKSELDGTGHLVVPLDVSDTNSIIDAWSTIKKWWDTPGGRQIFVYNAGAYEPIGAAQFDLKSIEQMLDVNLTGAIRSLSCIMPLFIERNAGHIVLVGSLAGYRGLPNALGYGASKAAINHLGENLKLDLANTKIKVQLVCPGFVRTRLTDKNHFSMPFLLSADTAADHIANGLGQNRFEIRFPWQMAMIFGFLKILPNRIYFWLARHLG